MEKSSSVNTASLEEDLPVIVDTNAFVAEEQAFLFTFGSRYFQHPRCLFTEYRETFPDFSGSDSVIKLMVTNLTMKGIRYHEALVQLAKRFSWWEKIEAGEQKILNIAAARVRSR